jgi:O-antigen/teichoic acid export membrane protein
MNDFRAGLRRLFNSSVLWSWALNGLRLASGLLLLPLLLAKLPEAEFGMYQVFLSLAALLPILDFGFSVSIDRYVSYAMAGARELKPMGLTPHEGESTPNVPMLWELLETTRRLFRYMSLAAFLLLGAIGTGAVAWRVQETAEPIYTWAAWAVTLGSVVLEIYAGWWNVFLRGMNEVLLSARISVLAYGLKLVLAIALLLAGAGLLAVPVAGLFSSLLQRQLSRHHCLKRLGPAPPHGSWQTNALLKILWPNSWRVGLQFLSGYLATQANVLICSTFFGLTAAGQFGLSLQIVGIIQGMATVWTLVKWPLVGQYRSRGDYPALRRLLWPRLWLQSLTFLLLAGAGWFFGPTLLKWQGSGKELLPPLLFGLLLGNGFLESQFSFWTTLLSTENRIPSLWPTVATNASSLLLVLSLIHFAGLELAAPVLSPLLAGSLFNYWFWPREGARNLQTRWWKFTFRPSG